VIDFIKTLGHTGHPVVDLATTTKDIEQHGYSIIRGFVDADRVAELRDLCESLKVPIETTGDDGIARLGFRIPEIMLRTRELDSLVTDPRLLAAFRMVLGATERWGMNLSDVSVKYLSPGSGERALHRDDDFYQQLSRDHPFTSNALLALDTFDEPVGATTVIPGSHGWEQPIDPDHDRISVDMDPGDLLLLSGRVWHGHGPNTTTDRIRRAFNVYVCAGWLLPGHTYKEHFSVDEFETLSPELQELMEVGLDPSKY
tara:strand:+ start:10309 stop:11079 length:771 start_codon:yes stop_codon:yes gene_type:complete